MAIGLFAVGANEEGHSRKNAQETQDEDGSPACSCAFWAPYNGVNLYAAILAVTAARA